MEVFPLETINSNDTKLGNQVQFEFWFVLIYMFRLFM
jgi:hypothetical protein